ncbi:trypsin, partial [Ostertagia ostertagi]
ISFRLKDGNEVSGNVQVLFKGEWRPVCEQNFGQTAADRICSDMNMGTPAVVLKPTTLNTYGWLIKCDTHCALRGFVLCRQVSRIRCYAQRLDGSSSCGVRRVGVAARDPLHSRFARVVGGFETVAGAFPWTAEIKVKAKTIVFFSREDRRPTSYIVVVGDWDITVDEGHEQTFDVSHLYFYPLYEDLFAHDLAILEIEHPGIRFDDWTQPICLPSRQFVYHKGRKCVASGWGSVGLSYPKRLQAAVVPIIDRAECMNSSRIYTSMSRSAFCAGYLEGGVDSCQGDSGGPLACQEDNEPYVLAGVISWGDGCAQKAQPGIYTMIAPYLSWIEGILQNR